MPFNVPISGYANGLSHQIPLNANYDIIWSFDYSLSGTPNSSQGGFTTFLFDGDVSTLQGGGIGKSLNYTSTNDYTIDGSPTSLSGVSGAVLGIAFDSYGYFSTSGHSLATGNANPLPNHLVIRGGQPDFELLTAVALSSIDPSFILLTPSEIYSTLRFRLGNVGNTIFIDKLSNNKYSNIFKYNVNLSPAVSTKYKVGISFASPINTAHNNLACFKIKNFHVEGIQGAANSTNNYYPSVSTYPLENNPSINIPDRVSTTTELIALPDRPSTSTPDITATPSVSSIDECNATYTSYVSSDEMTVGVGVSADITDYSFQGEPYIPYKNIVGFYAYNGRWLSGGPSDDSIEARLRDFSGRDYHMIRSTEVPVGQGSTTAGSFAPLTAHKSESQLMSLYNSNKTGFYGLTSFTSTGSPTGVNSIWNFREQSWGACGWFWPKTSNTNLRFFELITPSSFESCYLYVSGDASDKLVLVNERIGETGGPVSNTSWIVASASVVRDQWNFIGISYDHNTQYYTLRVGDQETTLSGTRIPKTQEGVRVGYTASTNSDDARGYYNHWAIFKRPLSSVDWNFFYNDGKGISWWEVYSETRNTLLKEMVSWISPTSDSGLATNYNQELHLGYTYTINSSTFPRVSAAPGSPPAGGLYAFECDQRYNPGNTITGISVSVEPSNGATIGGYRYNLGLKATEPDNPSHPTSFTHNMWVYFTQFNSSRRESLLNLWNPSPSFDVTNIRKCYSLSYIGQNVIWQTNPTGTTNYSLFNSITATSVLTLSTWHMLTCDWNKENSTINLWVDGTKVGTKTGVTRIAAVTGGGGQSSMAIGPAPGIFGVASQSDNHYWFTNAACWSRTLSANELSDLYNSRNGLDYTSIFYEGVTSRD